MHFDVAGPFEITRHGTKKIISKESLLHLRVHLEEQEEGLSESCGCYIFAKRVGGGILPWYVGQACCQPMFKEALNSDNIAKYNEVLDSKGTPLLFVLPARTPTGQLRKRPKSRSLASLTFLERWLIAHSIGRNPNLINSRETKFLRNLHVVGIFNPKQGEFTSASQELCKVLWK